MNKHSIILKISTFFIIALLATTALFKYMYDHQFESEKEELRIHYHHVAMSIMRWKIGDTTYQELINALEEDHMAIVEDKELYKSIQDIKKFDTVSCAKGDFHLYNHNSFRYVLIPPIVGKLLLKDTLTESINVSYVWWLYATFVVIMLLLLISIGISLYPLKQLQKQIKRFGEGDTSIDFFLDREDEIAQVSNEFNKAIKKINNVLEARKVFLRNTTHELKTPVTSGKIALELLEDSKSKDVLINVFTRLELLLKEFIQIEKITATNDELQMKEYPLTDILDQASDMLFLKSNSIKNNFLSNKVEVNFELFTFVFKNLIDNGLKYAQDDDFHIECSNDKIHFISRGQMINKPLEYYLQPFTKSKNKPLESFGLGLYIVDTILKKHHFSLSYKHKDNYNYFTINKY